MPYDPESTQVVPTGFIKTSTSLLRHLPQPRKKKTETTMEVFHLPTTSPLLTSIAAASILLFLLVSDNYSDRFATKSPPPLKFTHLHQFPPISDRFQAVHLPEISEELLAHRLNLRKATKTRLTRDEKLELGLARARAEIRRAAKVSNLSTTVDYVPSFAVYHNPRAFFQSYVEMERRFKVYVYPEGDLPITHDGPCKNIYTVEGRFIHEMEHGANGFRTADPSVAHVFFMPFSVAWMVKYLYESGSFDQTPLRVFVSDYVRVVSEKYPFWNKTTGADHFIVSCHDWGPIATEGNPFLYNTSIRVFCNANSSEGFNPQKDVSLPEIHLYDGDISPKLLSPPDTQRAHLAFFAGGNHGPIRPIILKHWKDRDSDIRVYEYLPKKLDYYELMLKSRFCLCPSGYEVASPRIVEAIYAECVPVIISEKYVLPFSDVLRWEGFSIKVGVSEIPRLKEILMGVSEAEYSRLKEGLRIVRKHFVLNRPAKRLDAFHMILHSIWLRRLNVRLA
ncbi:probable glycosyltransferase At5g25310 [Cucurbita maxima]|uniref:Probable glycosyltransferase At5g25310 n=1 Tax=Cucurbita maxima TaxID=3661 RepID=A0A6J1K598_CUCMA|nr:probable glycosyltransferase At5g25310 [Cucurbita maxima]